MYLSAGFGLPILTTTTASFSLDLSGACTSGAGYTYASGTITGGCGLAYGSGVTGAGHSFEFTVQGENLIFSGGIIGVADWQEDSLDSGSCFTMTATRFLLNGGWAAVAHAGGPSNYPPAAPSQMAPASGHVFGQTDTQTFTIQTGDPEQQTNQGRIRVRNSAGTEVAMYVTPPTESGAMATVTGPPLPAGSYTWAAEATNDVAYLSGYGPSSPWQPFSVTQVNSTFPSDDCLGGPIVSDGFAGGTYTRVQSRQPNSSTTWLCYRAEAAGVTQGGRVEVKSGSGAGAGIPSADDSWGACNAPGNLVPGPHPTLTGSVGDPADPTTYVPFSTDLYSSPTTAAFCVRVGSAGKRVVVPVPQAGTPPSVSLLSDPPGTHLPTRPPNPGTPSGTCQAAAAGATEYANIAGPSGRAWLHTWQETPTRSHVCVRSQIGATTGGRLTIDTTGATGATPFVTTSLTDTAPCALRVAGVDSPTTLDVRRSTSLTDTSGISFCVIAGTTKVRVTTGIAGSATQPQVTWTQDQ